MHQVTSASQTVHLAVQPSREDPSNASASIMVSSVTPTASTAPVETLHADVPGRKSRQTRNAQWYAEYGHRDIIHEKTIDLQGTLNYSKVNPLTRAQMVDWMVEVLTNLSRRFSEATFFKSIQIMDMHFKSSGPALTDSQVHLVGITAMYIGSKYEDVDPLRIQELTQDASYNKFSAKDVREKEMEVLNSFRYQVSFKTHVEVLDYFYFRIFSRHLGDASKDLRSLARNFCIMTIADVGFNDYDIRYVVLSCMVNAGLYLSNLAKNAGPEPSSRSGSHKLSGGASDGHWTSDRAETSRRMRSYVNKECVRGNFPREIWQLVEYVRVFLKKFSENYGVCRQIVAMCACDPRLLSKE